MKKKILFVSYGGGHVNMLMPIYKKILTNFTEQYDAQYLALTTAQNVLKDNNLPFFSYVDLLDSEEDSDAVEYGKSLLAELGDSGVIPTDESVAYLGLSYKDLVVRYGQKEAKTLYEEKNRHAFLQHTIAAKVLDELKPDIVITTNSPKTEKAFVLESQTRNIKCIVVIDMFNAQEVADRLGHKNYGDKLCVLNDYTKEILLEAGRNEDEVIVTGNPAFDQLFFKDADIKANQYKIQKNWTNKKNILWAKQAYPNLKEYNAEIDDALVQFVNSRDDVRLIFRPHPNDTTQYNFDHPNVYISREPSTELPLLLRCMDACLTINSTTGIEAYLLNVPVITFENTEATSYLSFANSNISSGVHSTKEAIDKIRSVLDQAETKTKKEQTLLGAENVILTFQSILNTQEQA